MMTKVANGHSGHSTIHWHWVDLNWRIKDLNVRAENEDEDKIFPAHNSHQLAFSRTLLGYWLQLGNKCSLLPNWISHHRWCWSGLRATYFYFPTGWRWWEHLHALLGFNFQLGLRNFRNINSPWARAPNCWPLGELKFTTQLNLDIWLKSRNLWPLENKEIEKRNIICHRFFAEIFLTISIFHHLSLKLCLKPFLYVNYKYFPLKTNTRSTIYLCCSEFL